jgi:hypothetical protein
MQVPDRISVEEAVWQTLESLGVPPHDAHRADAPLLGLLLDEDLTMGFVPDVEELLGLRVPPEDWERVQTVGETIRMLEEHARRER